MLEQEYADMNSKKGDGNAARSETRCSLNLPRYVIIHGVAIFGVSIHDDTDRNPILDRTGLPAN